MIKILIADDHALLRQGIRRVLNFEDDFEVVGETGDGEETLAKTLVMQPDVLLLDINMPRLNGLEVAQKMQQQKCATKIIALTIHDSDDYVLAMLKAGAVGFLPKDIEPEILVKAIHAVNEGNVFVYPQLAERIFGAVSYDKDDVESKVRTNRVGGRPEHLTAREMEVLACIAQGFSNQDIAEALKVSGKTVKNHLTNIFRKLGVSDRTQALVYVLKHKIISLE